MALPPKIAIQTAKFVWTTLWKIMMKSLAPSDRGGAYIRSESKFRHFITNNESSLYPPEANRYSLIIGYSCPWAHRTAIVRSLKGLDQAIALVVAAPASDSGIWMLPENFENLTSVPQLYQLADKNYHGRSTLPILWDSYSKSIVNNESSEIIIMLNSEFNNFARYPDLDLYPQDLQVDIDSWNQKIYDAVNNGVYRCGFAQTQSAFDLAYDQLFACLDSIDKALANSRFLCGDRLTLADIRLFTTLFRFDAVYFGLFKCDRHRIQDYAHLSGYVRDMYQIPNVAETCKLAEVRREYYVSLFPLNPSGIVPSLDLSYLLLPHGRD